MTGIDWIKYSLAALIIILLQVFIIQNVHFSTYIKPLPYIYLLLVMPFHINKYLYLFFAFILGFLIDILSDTYGMNATACVVLAFSKYQIDARLIDTDVTMREGYDYISLENKGIRFYIQYFGLLTLLHHVAFFLLSYFTFSAFFSMILTIVLSTIASLFLIYLYGLVNGRK